MNKADFDKLAALIRDYDILILSDEVYELMVYGGVKHESVLGHEELRAKSFAVFPFGKTYHAAGWKLAYCVAPEVLTSEFRKVHQFVTFTTSSFVQYAIADFMAERPEHTRELPNFYEQKRDSFCNLIAPSRLKFTPSKATYFQLVDYSEISDKNGVGFANYLTQEKGAAAIPLFPFYEEPPATKIVRFFFCKDDSILQQAAKILCEL